VSSRRRPGRGTLIGTSQKGTSARFRPDSARLMRVNELRALVSRLAEELGESVALRFGTDDDGEQWFELTPRNPKAAKATVHYAMSSDEYFEPWIAVEDEYLWPGDAESVAQVLQAVVRGDLHVREGIGRRELEVWDDGHVIYSGTSYNVASLVPSLRWRKRAKVHRYEPYE
jgi:hypothetical protein